MLSSASTHCDTHGLTAFVGILDLCMNKPVKNFCLEAGEDAEATPLVEELLAMDEC